MVELIQEKRFDDITVQQVIDRAKVGRATFYSHYRDKEDLFAKQCERFLDMLAQKIDWDNAGKGSFVPVVFLFRHLRDDAQEFYKGLVRSQKADPIFQTGIEILSQRIESSLVARLKRRPSVPIPIMSNYLASELFTLLKWWLDNGMPYTPEQMDSIYHQLINPNFKLLQADRIKRY